MGELVKVSQKAANMREFFEQRKGEIGMALARVGITPDRIIRALFTAAQKTPKLYECTLESTYKAMLLAAQSGLMPDGVTQQAHLIPRKNNKKPGKPMECNLQIGYRGYLTLCRRSGEVDVISGVLVRAGDQFKVHRGTEQRIDHEPLDDILGEDGEPRAITHAYAVAKFRSGSVDFESMPISEIEALRVRAQANGPAWESDYGEMCKKTVMRRLCKRLPQSEDASRLLELDAQSEGGLPQDLSAVEVPGIEEAKAVESEVSDAAPPPESPAESEDVGGLGKQTEVPF